MSDSESEKFLEELDAFVGKIKEISVKWGEFPDVVKNLSGFAEAMRRTADFMFALDDNCAKYPELEGDLDEAFDSFPPSDGEEGGDFGFGGDWWKRK